MIGVAFIWRSDVGKGFGCWLVCWVILPWGSTFVLQFLNEYIVGFYFSCFYLNCLHLIAILSTPSWNTAYTNLNYLYLQRFSLLAIDFCYEMSDHKITSFTIIGEACLRNNHIRKKNEWGILGSCKSFTEYFIFT